MIPSRYSTTMIRMIITTMVTRLVPLMRDLRTLDSGQVLEKPREQQERDQHQDDHHQYVNQVARPHVPTSLSTYLVYKTKSNTNAIVRIIIRMVLGPVSILPRLALLSGWWPLAFYTL
jgi:hypothetical protein